MSSLTTRDNKESIFFLSITRRVRDTRESLEREFTKKNNETLSTHPRTNKKKDTPNVLERYSKIKKKTLKVVLIYSIKPFFLLWIQLDRDRFIFNIFLACQRKCPTYWQWRQLGFRSLQFQFSFFFHVQVPCVKKKPTNQKSDNGTGSVVFDFSTESTTRVCGRSK